MKFIPLKNQHHFHRNGALAALLLAIFAFSLLAADTPTAVGPADQRRYLADIKTLTLPEMEGRGDGTKGLGKAAHLIEQRYKSLGLEPAGKKGFLQPFGVITGRRLRSGNRLEGAQNATLTSFWKILCRSVFRLKAR